MPYTLPNPDQPKTPEGMSDLEPLTTEEREALLESGWGSADGELLTRAINQLAPAIEAAAAAEVASAQAAVEANREYGILRSAGRLLRDAWATYDQGMRKISRDSDLSAPGRAKAEEKVGAQRAVAEAGVAQNAISDPGDRLLAAFPEPAFQSPSPDVIAEAKLIRAYFDVKAPSTTLEEAFSVLRRATDPAVPANERFRCNQLLRLAHQPLIERRVVAPERHARHLEVQAGELGGLIRTHLHTVLQVARHRHAIAAVELAQQDFTWLVKMARETGRWDRVFEDGAQFFDWSK